MSDWALFTRESRKAAPQLETMPDRDSAEREMRNFRHIPAKGGFAATVRNGQVWLVTPCTNAELLEIKALLSEVRALEGVA